MRYKFDCSQFVSARPRSFGHSELDLISGLKKIWGGDVLANEQISSDKLEYANEFTQSDFSTFEFVDAEFQGEFEDWRNIEDVPEGILKFESCIDEFTRCGYEIDRILIVEVPSQNERDIHRTNIQPFHHALFRRSNLNWEDGSGCRVLVVKLDTNESPTLMARDGS